MNLTAARSAVRPAPAVGPASRMIRQAGAASVRRPVLTTALLAFAGALLLQCWRPFFFLTDDAVADWLPTAVEAYRRLWEGRWPFYNEYLFGGVNLIQDSGTFTLLSPWALLCSFLARTPYYFFIPEVVGTLGLVTVAASFCWSALRLRERFALPVSTAWIVVLSLSYAFTPFNFIVNASWVGFFSAPAALPVIFVAAFEERWRKGLLLQTGALLYAILGGHMHPFTVLVLVAGCLVAAVACWRRRWQPFLVWAAAGALVMLVTSPLLVPALIGFGQDSRSAGLTVGQASFQRVPSMALLESFFLGPASHVFQEGIRIDLSDPLFSLSIAFALINLPLAAALACRRRWSGLEICLLAGAICTAVSIVRPHWLGQFYAHLPLLRSLRWPFREIATLHFFTHTLFLFLFQPGLTGWRRTMMFASATVGTLAYALVFLCVAPTFWLFGPDRRLLTSGEADRYWAALTAPGGGLRPEVPFIVEAEPEVLAPLRPAVPFTVLGGFDHASTFRTRNLMGFSATPPASARQLSRDARVEPYFWGGVYTHEAAMKVVAARPGTQRIVLTGMAPTRWEVVDGASVRRFYIGPDHLVHARPPGMPDTVP